MAEAKPEGVVKRMRGEVTGKPIVRRGADDAVTSVPIPFKAAFVGTVVVDARGDLARAYWSVTPGMKLSIEATETGKGRFTASAIELTTAAVAKSDA